MKSPSDQEIGPSRETGQSLVRILWAMLRTGADFDPTMCGVEEGPFTTAKTRRYRLLSASI